MSLVQELKAIKVQQKAMPRQLLEMQADVIAATAAANAASAASAASSARISQLEEALANASSTLPSADGQLLRADDPMIAGLRQRLVSGAMLIACNMYSKYANVCKMWLPPDLRLAQLHLLAWCHDDPRRPTLASTRLFLLRTDSPIAKFCRWQLSGGRLHCWAPSPCWQAFSH